MSGDLHLRIRCPDCDSELIVDRETGVVLSHSRPAEPANPGRSFEDLLRQEAAGRSRAEDLFEREKANLQDHDRRMDEKFRQALEQVDEDSDNPPLRPFDLD